ncbi:Rpn family recombination-promoting nuclease/putative transposase [Silvanigrella aquatica]|uniref:Transposase n=1 Tax=Silvanigrella aquatica TaxID=1915309 RepID=A0A1L4CX64_9BACT|nr:Rpn family recombination-promoting nuclease/putative transposase [Silvanigrella aquatica]APJ02537.1 hypothetical protein AXG55_00740 [Silvanigrella aquatica]
MEQNKLLDIKVDYVFKRIFGENEDIFIDFVNKILYLENENKIISAQFINTEMNKNSLLDKSSRFDVLAHLNDGSYLNIEVQMCCTHEYDKRCLYYWAKLYENQLKKGEDYNLLRPAICIHVLNFKLFNEKDSFLTKLNVVDMETQKIFSNDFQIIFLEVPKPLKASYNELANWMRFLKGAQKEEIIAMGNPVILKAQEKLEYLSHDPETRAYYDSRQKYLHDYATEIRYREEKGRQEGRQEGVEVVAKNLILKGMPIDFVASVTNLSMEEIKKISEN